MMSILRMCDGADLVCVAYPATCEVKDSMGTLCVSQLMIDQLIYGSSIEESRESCEGLEKGGVTKECLPLLVESKLDFKTVDGSPMLKKNDADGLLSVINACATGTPLPETGGGGDEELTPIDASVTLADMTKDQFDAEKFATAMADTLDVNTEDVTDVKVEEIAASSKRRSLTATDLKVSFKVAVKDTMEATEASEKLTEAVENGSLGTKLEEAGITGFSSIKAPTVAVEQAPEEDPSGEGGDGSRTPTTTTSESSSTTTPTTTKAEMAPATKVTTTKATTVTTKATTTTTAMKVTTTATKVTAATTTTKSGGAKTSFFVGVAAIAAAAMAA